ncbi:MAG TPA: L,D-transpeptidase [Polyangiaceae bacterium]
MGVPRLRALAPLLALWANVGCQGGSDAPSLSRTETIIKSAPVPPERGPQLGIVAELVIVREATDPRAASLGVLHAGARVARSAEPVSHLGCGGGWYAVRPRGFVCAGPETTLDLSHPTLAAMALPPTLDANLPYTYARARVETALLEREPARPDGVREVGKLRRRAGMAVVGSWKAKDADGVESRLALLTSGRFVRAADLEAAKPSDFAGVELTKDTQLPLAFVVKRGVRTFRVSGNEAEKGDLLEYHARLALSGRFRSVGSVKYWALAAGTARGDDAWVRHQDVTVLQKRASFPDFVQDDTRWLDVSVVTGTLLAYEGKRAVFATLVSVARELEPGGSETEPASDNPRSLPLGTFPIKQKNLIYSSKAGRGFGESFEVLDAPWALELGSGQLIHGAYWHDRFGIEHGAGNLALSPSDAARVFRFVQPELPSGWHAVAARPEQGVQVVLRK